MGRRRAECGASVVATAALVAATVAGCSGQPSAPAGYERLGTVDGSTVYARREGADRLAVIVRSSAGDILCNASGPVVPDDPSASSPALCDDTGPDAYAYVLPVVRSGVARAPAMCDKQSGSQVGLARVATPTAWSSDLLVAVRPAPFPGIGPCPGG